MGLTTSRVAHADEGPSPERLTSAAEEFDLGRRAYIAKDWEQAAVHFENAHRDAPRAETLRLAIRARRESKQLARAATLAAEGETTYANDPQTAQLVRETLAEAAPSLQEYEVRCSQNCTLVADGRLVAEADASTHRIFLEPGPHELGIGFVDRPSLTKRVEAARGARESLTFEAPAKPSAPAPPTPPAPVVPPASDARPKDKPLGPALFFVGVGVTALAAGATVWSGIDTVQSPGREAVRQACAGRDETCEPYQEGNDKELRTNLLLGATVGLAVVTGVIGIFFTRWSAPAASSNAGQRPLRVQAIPSFLPGGAGASLHATF